MVKRRASLEFNYGDCGFLKILNPRGCSKARSGRTVLQFLLAARSSACRERRCARTRLLQNLFCCWLHESNLHPLHSVPACSCGFAGPAPTTPRKRHSHDRCHARPSSGLHATCLCSRHRLVHTDLKTTAQASRYEKQTKSSLDIFPKHRKTQATEHERLMGHLLHKANRSPLHAVRKCQESER